MKLKWPFGRTCSERELADELEFHLEEEFQNNLRRGMPAEEARREARLAFGGLEGVRQECRELRFGSWCEATLRDLVYGLRLLRKSPGFALVAMAILALGIGVNTAIFSAVNAVLLTRWPFPHPEKIVLVSENASRTASGSLVSVANFEDYRRDQKTFDELALWGDQSVNLTGQDRPERLIGSFGSANFFSLFGTKPWMGRLFLPGEDQPGANYVAVLSYQAWQTRFGSDPNILGRHITLNNESYSVIGVLPRGYRLPFECDIFLTMQHLPSYKRDRSTKELWLLGRVKDGTRLAQARADLNRIAQRLAGDYPKENAGIEIGVWDFREVLNRSVRTPLLVLLGAVVLVLLIACANLANLLLARGVQRQSEFTLRVALGAKRLRIVRLLLSEAMLIAVCGGIGGVLLAYSALPLFLRLAPSTFQGVKVTLDIRVLMFSSLLTFLTGTIFGVAPALQLSRVREVPIGSGSRGAVTTVTGAKVRAVFVICQVAISIVLLVAAGLLIRSFHTLATSATGMSMDRLLTMEYRLPRNKYSNPQSQSAFHRDLALRVAQAPGVVSSAIVQALPFSGNWGTIKFVLLGFAPPERGKEPSAYENMVTPAYFATVGIPVLRGRNLDDHDDATTPPVAVISRALANRYFTGQDPVGRTVQLMDEDPTVDGKRVTIVGVVGDANQVSLRDTDKAEIYFPYAQHPGIFGTLVIRTSVDPMSLADSVRQAVWSLDKDQPVWKVRTLEFLVDRDSEGDRLLMTLMGGFGALAVILTALGTYGVLSNTVNQRRREIGIRMALGAGRGVVRNMVMSQGMKLVLAGCAIGLVVAVAASRTIASLLYGVGALDIAAYGAGLAVMLVVASLASYLPARRATQVDPAIALRCE